MNKSLNKPIPLKEDCSAEEVSEWFRKETEYKIKTFLEEKEKLGEEVEYSQEGMVYIMKIHMDVIEALKSTDLVK